MFHVGALAELLCALKNKWCAGGVMKTTECLERAHGALGARAERERVMFFQLDTIFEIYSIAPQAKTRQNH